MMKSERPLWRHTGRWMWLLLTLCVLLAAPFTTWGRYDTAAGGSDSARAACPVVTLTDTAGGAHLSPGGTGSYAFAVSNADAGRVSETAMTYRITVRVYGGSRPYGGGLDWRLYTGTTAEREKAALLAGSPEQESLTVGERVVAENRLLPAGKNSTAYYWLEYTPDSAGQFDLQVSVTAVQSDE